MNPTTKKVLIGTAVLAGVVLLISQSKPEPTRTPIKIPANTKEAIRLLIAEMKAEGITNKYIQAAILAVISKESNFVPQVERGYSTTSNERIKSIFPTKLGSMSDSALTSLKADEKRFFDTVYGGKYGNAKNEGYKYRGRGFNQLTFKSNYRTYGDMIGVDLVSNPDSANRLDVAAAIAVAYMKDHFKKAPALQRAAYHFNSINDFRSLTDAAKAAYNANAGWGKSPTTIAADKTGGYALTLGRASMFYNML